jgi:GNAT superfamily N-acetyltransferase
MPRPDGLSISLAEPDEAAPIAALRSSVAEHLTRLHGRGHWSSCPTEASVRREIKSSRVLVARRRADVVGTVRLATKKPWAIDLAYFTAVPRAMYLHGLAVAPEAQRQGIGHGLIEEAKATARAWPSQAIRLDAYDHPAGAGAFYRHCGFREVGRVTYRHVPLVYFERLF